MTAVLDDTLDNDYHLALPVVLAVTTPCLITTNPLLLLAFPFTNHFSLYHLPPLPHPHLPPHLPFINYLLVSIPSLTFSFPFYHLPFHFLFITYLLFSLLSLTSSSLFYHFSSLLPHYYLPPRLSFIAYLLFSLLSLTSSSITSLLFLLLSLTSSSLFYHFPSPFYHLPPLLSSITSLLFSFLSLTSPSPFYHFPHPSCTPYDCLILSFMRVAYVVSVLQCLY